MTNVVVAPLATLNEKGCLNLACALLENAVSPFPVCFRNKENGKELLIRWKIAAVEKQIKENKIMKENRINFISMTLSSRQ